MFIANIKRICRKYIGITLKPKKCGIATCIYVNTPVLHFSNNHARNCCFRWEYRKTFVNQEAMFSYQHQKRPLRLAVYVLLQCRVGDFFALVATVCSSWVSINVGTSRRSLLYPEGADLPYVTRANCMVSRTIRG